MMSREPIGQMLIYSGRPDPHWSITIDDWKELNQLIETLTGKVEHQGEFDEPSFLGYRGFVGDWNEERIYFIPQTKQAVKAKTTSFTVYNDPLKSVEMWFIKNAKKNGGLELHIPDN